MGWCLGGIMTLKDASSPVLTFCEVLAMFEILVLFAAKMSVYTEDFNCKACYQTDLNSW